MRFSMRLLFPFICMVILGFACGLPSEEEVAATISSDVNATVSAIPTQTPLATFTNVPTFTPLPTHTPEKTLTPWPTYTPFPTQTHTPTATATAAPNVLFAEDFDDDRSCFMEEFTDGYSGRVTDEAFQVIIRNSNWITWFGCPTESFDSFNLNVDVEVVSGRNELVYGMHIREESGQDGWRSYEFLINSEGGICIRYRDLEGNYINLTNSVTFDGSCWIFASELIRPNTVQTLQITAANSVMSMQIDGEIVAVVRDVELSRGNIGFVVWVFEVDEPVEVVFDNVLVTALEPE